MPSDRPRLRRVQRLLLRLLAALEAPRSAARTKTLRVLRASLQNDLPEALRTPTRQSVLRDLERVRIALGDGHARWNVDGLVQAVRWYGTNHPVLLTLIILLLIIVLAWRQNFTLTTRLGNAEIRIEGLRPVPNSMIGPQLPSL